MNKIEVIRERIERVIKQEEDITQRELEKWSHKKHEEESYWGIGGNYRRYEKLEESRMVLPGLPAHGIPGRQHEPEPQRHHRLPDLQPHSFQSG